MRPVIATIAIVGGLVVAGCTPTTPTPSSPAVEPSSSPAVGPSASPASAARVVTLPGSTGSRITLAIDDASGTLLEATAGPVTDGASVEPYRLTVTNDDPATLRLVWAGGPCDLADSLSIDATARRFMLVEPECPGDLIAFDRVLLLRFAGPVPAGEVHGIVGDGLDTGE